MGVRESVKRGSVVLALVSDSATMLLSAAFVSARLGSPSTGIAASICSGVGYAIYQLQKVPPSHGVLLSHVIPSTGDGVTRIGIAACEFPHESKNTGPSTKWTSSGAARLTPSVSR